MDDSEPDLYGGLGGHQPDDQDLQSSYNGRDGGYGDCTKPHQEVLELKPVPMFVFYNIEELVTSDVFQRQLSMALKSKGRQIDELRVEILELHEQLEVSKRPKSIDPHYCPTCIARNKRK